MGNIEGDLSLPMGEEEEVSSFIKGLYDGHVGDPDWHDEYTLVEDHDAQEFVANLNAMGREGFVVIHTQISPDLANGVTVYFALMRRTNFTEDDELEDVA